jgi:HEPN domain-containing protein
MSKALDNWLKSSDYDIKTAQALLKSKRYVYVIFMCHLSVEKALKALVVNRLRKAPPKTHDLLYLANLAGVEIPKDHESIMAHLNEASVPTRYPEDMTRLVKSYNKRAAERYLRETKDLLKWLRAQID